MDHIEINSAGSGSSNEEATTDFGISRADFAAGEGGDDPVVMERIQNFKLDPNQLEIVEDEDEDRPLELHVHCDRFLSAPSEHIEPLFREIPLEDPDNFAELTEDITCSPHFANKCHLITASQMEKIWTKHSKKGLEALRKISCLQRLTDFSAFKSNEALEVIKAYPLSDWESWWSFPPETLLEIVVHQKYSDRLKPATQVAQISEFLANPKWKSDFYAWQLFDEPFIRLIAESPSDSQRFYDMLAFNIRFPDCMLGKLNIDELLMIPRWAVRVYKFALMLISGKVKSEITGKMLKGLISELFLADDFVSRLTSDKRRLKSAIRLAKSAVLLAPTQFFLACDEQQPDSFKIAKQLREDILGFPAHEDIIRALEKLKISSNSEAEKMYTRAELSSRFHKRSLKDVCAPMKLEFGRDFLQVTCRPDMSVKELLRLKEFLKEDLKDIPEPKLTQQEQEDDDLVLIHKVPQKVREWFTSTWLSGCNEAFLYVCEQLNQTWKSTQTTDELIVELADQDPGFIECALHVLKDPRKAIQLIMRDDPDAEFNLEIANKPWEEIHNLPLNDQQFFKPSFDILASKDDPSITYHWFTVKFTNEKGVDGGGPRRNWISKMLYAWIDPKRFLLRTHDKSIVPEIFVDFQVFFALGRLIGKGIHQDAGLPFAFHPDFVDIIHDYENVELMEKHFKNWYEAEIRNLEQTLAWADSLGDGNLEDIEDLALISQEHWKLADDQCGSNIGITGIESIRRGCRVPIGKELQTGKYIARSLEEWIDQEGAEHKELDKERQAQKFSAAVHPSYCFTPKTVSEVQTFTKAALETAMNQFKAGIEAFMQGLDAFVEVKMLRFMNRKMLGQVFSPTIEIDVSSLLASFQYINAENLSVAVKDPQSLPSELQQRLLRTSGAMRMSIVDAFQFAISKLSMEELHGFVGQMTGSRVTGLGTFQPNRFKAIFSQTPVSRPLIDPEEQGRCKSPRHKLAKKGREEEEKQTQNKELPFTASCNRSIHVPLYATLEEICLAILLVARASDEFPRT